MSKQKNRPAQLVLSPSDGALNIKAAETSVPEEDEAGAVEERVVQSDVSRLFSDRSLFHCILTHCFTDRNCWRTSTSRDETSSFSRPLYRVWVVARRQGQGQRQPPVQRSGHSVIECAE